MSLAGQIERASIGGVSRPHQARRLGLDEVGTSSIERWFAAAGKPVRLDLARSGAPARSVADLLDLADPADVETYLSMPLDYGAGVGSARLRHAISDLTGAPASDVVVTHGAVEALLLTCAACMDERRLIAVANPGYEGLTRAAEAAGGIAHPVEVWRPGWNHLDLARLADLKLSRYAAVLINSPHNPTGLEGDPKELEDLADRCRRAGTALIVDQVSQGTLDPSGNASGVRTVGRDAVALIGDVSKAFGLGGLRVGWCVMGSSVRRARVAALRDLTSLGSAGPSEHLAAIALENRDRLSVSDMADANLRYLGSWLDSVPGAGWVPPTDGLVTFPELPLPCLSRPFAERLRATCGVSVAPGSFFGYDRHLRIGLGLRGDHFQEGLGRLAESLARDDR